MYIFVETWDLNQNCQVLRNTNKFNTRRLPSVIQCVAPSGLFIFLMAVMNMMALSSYFIHCKHWYRGYYSLLRCCYPVGRYIHVEYCFQLLVELGHYFLLCWLINFWWICSPSELDLTSLDKERKLVYTTSSFVFRYQNYNVNYKFEMKDMFMANYQRLMLYKYFSRAHYNYNIAHFRYFSLHLNLCSMRFCSLGQWRSAP